MQITGPSSNLPLSTQIIQKAGQAAQSPNAPINPEQVNTIVDQGVARAEEARESREQSQTDRRSAATQMYAVRSEQQQLDTYMAVASEGEVDDSQSSPQTVLELRDEVRRYEVLQDIGDNVSRPEWPTVEPHINTHV